MTFTRENAYKAYDPYNSRLYNSATLLGCGRRRHRRRPSHIPPKGSAAAKALMARLRAKRRHRR